MKVENCMVCLNCKEVISRKKSGMLGYKCKCGNDILRSLDFVIDDYFKYKTLLEKLKK